jgi:hypothetical protein
MTLPPPLPLQYGTLSVVDADSHSRVQIVTAGSLVHLMLPFVKFHVYFFFSLLSPLEGSLRKIAAQATATGLGPSQLLSPF